MLLTTSTRVTGQAHQQQFHVKGLMEFGYHLMSLGG